MSRLRFQIRLGLGLLISAVFLWLALRNVEWAEVLQALRLASPLGLLAGLPVLVGAWVAAAVRWRVLLDPAPGLRVRDTFAYICIGFLANTVLPFRLGELARATFIGRQKGLGVGRAMGSIAVERVFDLLAAIVLALTLTRLVEIPETTKTALTVMIGLAFVAFGGLLILSFNQDRLHRLTDFFARWLPRPLVERVVGLALGFASGAGVVRRPAGLAAVAGLSAALWTCGGLATLIWIRAFHLDAPWVAGLLVLVSVNLGSAIPSSPGYVGVYHGAAVWALTHWVAKEPALAYALVTHALNMLANVVAGSFFLAQKGLSLKGLQDGGMTEGGGMKPET